jgi:dipeptidyl aminopeptidase/acylaminoacyl peptidase
MFRGYVDPKKYSPGIGTNPVAHVLAENGYITLAPDFLGYGESSKASDNAWENRFQTYTVAATMLDSVKNVNAGLKKSSDLSDYQIDPTKTGIWAHSNGGHIALSTLAITGVTFPTVLWAPVSKEFPYSILYYTDESDDGGKSLRSLLATFEEDYNVDSFDPAKYYKWIKAPIQINQGLNDEEVPYWWSESLEATLKKDGDDVTLNEYPNADHNLSPDGWTPAVQNALQFYNEIIY